MPIHASPGVYFETIDFSLYAPKLSKTILALAGKTRKGPTEPTFVSSVRQFVDLFGTPRVGEYSSLAAVSFLEFGSSLWFSRILGPAARKASVNIPTAMVIKDELVATATNDNSYIFNIELEHPPVPGTLELKLVDPNNPSNYSIINDDGNGSFPLTLNPNISQYSNFIDYDTGEYRFTLATEPVSGSEISIKYNTVTRSVTDEETLIVEVVDEATATYNGMLSHSNLVNMNTFKLEVESGTTGDTYIFTVDGAPDNGIYQLSGINLEDSPIGSGSINAINGAWEVTFSSDINVAVGDIFKASYDYNTFKIKTLGKVGDISSEGYVYNKAFIGSLNSVVYPGTVTILVNGEEKASDNGEGRFIGNVVTAENKIDYVNKKIDIALSYSLKAGYQIFANYSAKYLDIVEVVSEEKTTDSISGILSKPPITKESVRVKIGGALVLVDDGDGNLIKDNSSLSGFGNGTINYDTGEFSINYMVDLSAGDMITVDFLSKMGSITALYEGEYYNGIKVRFTKDSFGNYGLEVWTPELNVNQLPSERFKNIRFDDPSDRNFITNSVISNYINITLENEEAGNIPILNTVLQLTDGYDDYENITEQSAVSALSQFANTERYDINLVACPDFPGSRIVINKLIQLCEVERGDCFAIIDPPRNLTVQEVVNWHNGAGRWLNENSLNSSFAALYYPWIQISDEFSESLQWVPPSVRIVSVFAYNDRVAEVWNAPAGLNRGRLFKVQKTERQLNVADRDLLYATGTNAVNPICDFVGDGIVVYGQKTLQRKPSALDRVNVMRLIIYVTKILATATKYLLFEPNDRLTWTLYTQMVDPLLSDIKQRRGLYEFKVVCDETTNTPSDIDNNTMVAEVWLRPTKVAERLINRFVITSTGASFSELRVGE